MDNSSILKLTKKENANYDTLLNELSNFLSRKQIQINQVAIYLYVCRYFKSSLSSNKDKILKLVKSFSDLSKEHKLFVFGLEYFITHDQSIVHQVTEFLISKYSADPVDLIPIDDGGKISSFFYDGRSYDFMSGIIRWARQYTYNPDDLECLSCGSVMFPNLKKTDLYRCSNPKCTKNKEYYSSHCWYCGDAVDSDHNYKCQNCGWYICKGCGKCEEHNKCKDPVPLISHIYSVKKIDKENTLLERFYLSLIKAFTDNPSCIKLVNTKRGTNILQTEEELNYYNLAYFKTHYLKLKDTLSQLPSMSFQNGSTTILDWGCGQGLGSLVFLEKFHDKLNKENFIFLVEPSEKALHKASENLMQFFAYPAEKIIKVNSSFEKLDISKINIEGSIIHIMSNILDVNLNIKCIFDLVQKHKNQKQFFICVSPNYPRARDRFKSFYKSAHEYFGAKVIHASSESIQGEIFYLSQNKFIKKNIPRIHMIIEKK